MTPPAFDASVSTRDNDEDGNDNAVSLTESRELFGGHTIDVSSSSAPSVHESAIDVDVSFWSASTNEASRNDVRSPIREDWIDKSIARSIQLASWAPRLTGVAQEALTR